MAVDIIGIYSTGQTSKSTKVTLRTAGERFTLVSQEQEEVLLTADQSSVTISSRLGNTPRRLEFSGGEVFHTDDNDAVDSLEKAHGRGGFATILHKVESHLGLVGASVVLTVIIVWITVTEGIPLLAEQIAFQLPQSVQESIGSGSLDLLDQSLFSPSNLESDEEDRLRSLFLPILGQETSVPSVEFRSGVGPNAFALPDGTVVLTDELIELADSDEELLAVLYHEIGHLHHRHTLRRMLQDSIVTLLVVFVTGDVESASILTGLPTLVLDLSYSRNFELEADRFALESLSEEGIDLSSFEQVIRKLGDATESSGNVSSDSPTGSSVLNYLSTHPATPERLALITEYEGQ